MNSKPEYPFHVPRAPSPAGTRGRQVVSTAYPANIVAPAAAQAEQEPFPPIGFVAPTGNTRTPKQIDAEQQAAAYRRRMAETGAEEAPPDKARALPKTSGDEFGFLDAALAYAAQQLYVFPLHPASKAPAVSRGFYSSTTNPAPIKRYWRISNRNVAVRTGLLSGIWVLDVDGDRGEASIRRLEAEHGPLPPTLEVISGGGGRHLWFRYTTPVPSTVGRIAFGIDTRGDGGYILAPPSIHDETGRPYWPSVPCDRWSRPRSTTGRLASPRPRLVVGCVTTRRCARLALEDHHLWSVDSVDDLAIAPDWLVALARKRPQPVIPERAAASIHRPNGKPGAYGAAALDRECTALAAVGPGARNHALNRAAFRLFQLVAGGELDGRTVGEQLVEACRRNGLAEDDGLPSVLATARSGARAGLRQPRSRGGAA